MATDFSYRSAYGREGAGAPDGSLEAIVGAEPVPFPAAQQHPAVPVDGFAQLSGMLSAYSTGGRQVLGAGFNGDGDFELRYMTAHKHARTITLRENQGNRRYLQQKAPQDESEAQAGARIADNRMRSLDVRAAYASVLAPLRRELELRGQNYVDAAWLTNYISVQRRLQARDEPLAQAQETLPHMVAPPHYAASWSKLPASLKGLLEIPSLVVVPQYDDCLRNATPESAAAHVSPAQELAPWVPVGAAFPLIPTPAAQPTILSRARTYALSILRVSAAMLG